jgi:signal transduction histidine kinase
LDATKFGTIEESVTPTPTKVCELLQNLMVLLDRRARNRNVHLDWKIDKEVPEVIVVDSFKLGQILSNLLVNAIKFCEPGKGFVSVQVGFTPATAIPPPKVGSFLQNLLNRGASSEVANEERWLRFQIVDNGVGISPDVMPLLFHLFQQGRSDVRPPQRLSAPGDSHAILFCFVPLDCSQVWRIRSWIDDLQTFG